MEKKSGSNFCKGFYLIGFPDEIGVSQVKGRLGAKAGPESFFRVFERMNGVNPVISRKLGSELVAMGDDLEKNYASSVRSVRDHAGNSIIVAIGGGHDYAYPWISGMVEDRKKTGSKNLKIGCINLDAHFDLRTYEPVMTSGSPFCRVIEEGVLLGSSLVEFGIQDHCNAPELWEYAKAKKVKTIPFSRLRNGVAVRAFRKELQALKKKCDEVVISIDLDSLSLAFCPGVSAPQGEGFTASELYQMLEIAGADKKVTSIGFFELAPPLDHQDQTSRVAAQAAWHFLNAKFFPSKRG